MVDQLIKDFSSSIKAEKIKIIIDKLKNRRPGLIFGKPYDQEVRDILQKTPVEELFSPEKVRNKTFARAVVSGLLIWNDCEAEAHSIAQDIQTAEGSYFHAIIHRREPDIWNSGYWFNRVGKHPVFTLIYDFVASNANESIRGKILSTGEWDPESFNKVVEAFQNGKNSDTDEIINIQHAELLFIIAHSYRHALGS